MSHPSTMPPSTAHLDPADATVLLTKWQAVVDAERAVEIGAEQLKEDRARAKKLTQAFREFMRDLGTPDMYRGQ